MSKTFIILKSETFASAMNIASGQKPNIYTTYMWGKEPITKQPPGAENTLIYYLEINQIS